MATIMSWIEISLPTISMILFAVLIIVLVFIQEWRVPAKIKLCFFLSVAPLLLVNRYPQLETIVSFISVIFGIIVLILDIIFIKQTKNRK